MYNKSQKTYSVIKYRQFFKHEANRLPKKYSFGIDES